MTEESEVPQRDADCNASGKATPDVMIRRYYECLNARRFDDAATTFAPDAILEYLPLREPLRGQSGSVEFARRWMEAFPDGQLRIDRVEQRGDILCEVDLVASGTQLEQLDLGVYQFKPSRAWVTLRLRQLFEFHQGRAVFSSLSFDIHDLIRQLASIDYSSLQLRLADIHRLGQELAIADDVRKRREVCERLGTQLDAARQVLRPYFYR